MTADRVVVLILIVAGIALVAALNRRKLARMNSEERAQFDRNIAPFARSAKLFMWLVVIGDVVLAIDAAAHEVWPVSIAAFVLAVGLGIGVAYRSRWWLGK
jgi:hypothetical protein